MLQQNKTRTKKPGAQAQVKSTRTRQSSKKAQATHQPNPSSGITREQRQSMIQIAAYYIAERDGFCRQSPLDYWLAAEAEIDRQLMQQSAE